MTLAIILGVAYILLLILIVIISSLHKKIFITRKLKDAPKSQHARLIEELPTPLMKTFKERLSFTIKDKRSLTIKDKQYNISRKKLFFFLYLAGLLIAITAGFMNKPSFFLASLLLFIASMTFGVKSPKKLLEERKSKTERMRNIATSKGLSTTSDPLNKAVNVLDWGEDYISPKKIEFMVRDEFAQEQEEGFLRQFNQIFGQETSWVPSDDPETGKPGWDYEMGKVTIHAVPPLPTMAPWSEKYVINPAIAWSFFPIALGIENGVELVNSETGEVENVLGFDLSGEQAKVGKKAGVKVSNTITTSPMVFIGGGTGGGKSLAVNTPVKVIENVDNSPIPKNQE